MATVSRLGNAAFSRFCDAAGLQRQDAQRPAIPPVLRLALGLWVGAAVSYLWAEGLVREMCVVLSLICIVCGTVCAVVCFKVRTFYLCWGLVLGLACGFAGGTALHVERDMVEAYAARSSDADPPVLRMTAKEDAKDGFYGLRCWMDVQLSDGSEITVLSYIEGTESVSFGQSFWAECGMSLPAASNAEYCWQNGAAGVANARVLGACEPTWPQSWLLSLREASASAFRSLGGDEGALLAALICNDRRTLDEGSLYDDYRITGLAHIVAVSGSHLVIVGSLFASLLKALRSPRWIMVIVQAMLMLGYLLFSAAPISAVRAVVMSALGLSSFFVRRRTAPLNALAACIVAMVVVQPETALSASFVLSAGSSLGISLVSPLISSWLSPLRPLPDFAKDALAMTLAAGVATAPYSAALFSQISVVSPLANIVAAPLFTIVCTSGIASAALVLSFGMALKVSSEGEIIAMLLEVASSLTLEFARLSARLMNEAVGFFAGLSFVGLPANMSVIGGLSVSAGLLFALWRVWPQLTKRFALAAAVLLLVLFAACASPFPRGERLVMLDVGQGDAILVQSGFSSILVDTGTNDSMLLSALARAGVSSLDAVIITHPDDDHCGSLLALRGVVRVETVMVAADTFDCNCESCVSLMAKARDLVGENGVVALNQGDVILMDNVRTQVLWPASFSNEGGNEDSVCLHVGFDLNEDGVTDWGALLVGDAEAEELHAMIDQGLVDSVDMLKVGHHGSKNALDDEVLEVLSPKIALISVGENNRYGHPNEDTMTLLNESGAQVFRTDKQGDVTCSVTANSVKVSTCP